MRSKGDRPDYDDQVGIVGGKAGYEHVYFAEAIRFGNNPYGNAMMSHYPFEAQTVLIPESTPEEKAIEKTGYEIRCVLRADYDFGGKKLTVLTAHFGLFLLRRG